MENVGFSWIDYFIFALTLGSSCILGLCIGCKGKHQTTMDYILGGRNLKVIPVAFSLVSSTLSAITLLSYPTEIYFFGTQHAMILVSIVWVAFLNYFIFLPVFYKLELVTLTEYIQMRFGKDMRCMLTVLMVVLTVIYQPLVMYAPSLALNQVSGINVHIVSAVMTFVCIFYTVIGGLKGVVWSDTLQFVITLITLFILMIMGIISAGGLGNIWGRAKAADRIEFFNFDFDPTVRNTFWSTTVGCSFIWMGSHIGNPAIVQRFNSLPTMNKAKWALITSTILIVIIKSSCFLFGLTIYGYYFDCDPFTTNLIKKKDQIVPYYVLNVAKDVPGLSGLFIAGLFSTALSTLSTYLNTVPSLIYVDFISPHLSINTSDQKAKNIIRAIGIAMGLSGLPFIIFVEKFKTILEIMISITAIISAPLVGIFFLALLNPFANSKVMRTGLLVRGLTTILFLCFLIVRSQMYVLSDANSERTPKPLYVFGCGNNANETIFENGFHTTTIAPSEPGSEPAHWIFRISFQYYHMMGTLMTVLIGSAVSWITGREKDCCVNLGLLHPWVHRFAPKSEAPTVQVSDEGNELNSVTYVWNKN